MKKIIAALGAGALAVALAACGSSSSGAGAQGVTAKVPTGDPIVIGFIGSDTGGFKATYARGKTAITAWQSSVNDAGGINGHAVKVVTVDDAGDAATGLKVAKQLVEQDKVIAVVGEASGTSSSWSPYLTQKGVPVVGGPEVQGHFATSANSFATGAPLTVIAVGQLAMAKAAGKSSLGIAYCSESPLCDLSKIYAAAGTVVGGVKVANNSSVAATTTDYSSTCLSMKGDGVDVIFSTLEAGATARMFADCKRQGITALATETMGSYDVDWLKDANMNGVQIAFGQALWTDPNNKGGQAMLTAIGKYAPSLNDDINSTVVYTWLGGELFKKAAEAANVGPTSTPADVKKGLYALKGETLDGMAPPLTYTEGKPTVLTCYFGLTIDGGKLAAVNGNTQAQCLSADQLTALSAALGA